MKCLKAAYLTLFAAIYYLQVLFNRVVCGHRRTTFVRNIYGDEIIEYGWKRSIHKCDHCGKYVYGDMAAHEDLQRGQFQ